MSCLLNLIFKLIQASWLYYLAQILLTSSMWISVVDKISHFDDAIAEMAGNGLNPPVFFVLFVVGVQLIGSLLVIFGRRWAWLGAGALAVFTIMTIIVVHHFWTRTGADYDAHLSESLDHLILIGGLILSAIASVLKYHSQTLTNIFNK